MRRIGETLFLWLSFLAFLVTNTNAGATPCRRLDGDWAIRRAVTDGAMIVISSRGTFANCEDAFLAQPIERPSALTIRFATLSAAVPEADERALQVWARRALSARSKIEIVARAYSVADPSHAARLAFSRAAALRELLLEWGATPAQLSIQAKGGRLGEDRVDLFLTASARAPPDHV